MKLELLTYSTDQAAIKKQYRDLAKKLHPDKPTGSKEKFQQLQDEYSFLMNGGKPSPGQKKQSTANPNEDLTEDELRTMFEGVSTEAEAQEVYQKLLKKIRSSRMGWLQQLAMEFVLGVTLATVIKKNNQPNTRRK